MARVPSPLPTFSNLQKSGSISFPSGLKFFYKADVNLAIGKQTTVSGMKYWHPL